ncbi:MAG: Queuosine Biosynthesis QueC ATPase [uncultured Thiotrichaceae bacterium]|uniref:7-cyano-7-deazaguanine synthase n=1 Tax=uncultured Thiotrichaceae bacterium TaxID=298394 RepID=A0A6S6U1H9_9GAMM|nr:MAG: Queuosine Biosynthesis QueC ATPase [uncultured Thiotrichaceae bacterium]
MNQQNTEKPAVILLSGGMDSATVLAIAKQQNYQCYALSFRYGQRHSAELVAAKKLALSMGVERHEIIDLDLTRFGGSALTDDNIDVPKTESEGIPVTYVPARNTVFLSIALGWAEVLNAQDIFIGVNAVDYSGYPDCRPEFIRSFQETANLATRKGVEGEPFIIHTPLIDLTKADIIRQGVELGIDYTKTITCYNANANGEACGECDACRLRQQGFTEAGVEDQTIYAAKNSE